MTEVFPTNIRTTMTSLLYTGQRATTIISPYIINLDEVLLIIGSATFTSGILNLIFVPETGDREMPETVQDILDLFKSRVKISPNNGAFENREITTKSEIL